MSDNESKKAITPELKAIIVLFIFIILGPPLQMLGYLAALQEWTGVEYLLADFLSLVQKKFFPALLPSYAQYMPACFIIGWYLKNRVQKSYGFSFYHVILSSLLATLGIELLSQIIIYFLGAPFHLIFSFKMFWLSLIGALVNGIICWVLCSYLKLNIRK